MPTCAPCSGCGHALQLLTTHAATVVYGQAQALVCRPGAGLPKPEAGDAHLPRWPGPNITRALLVPHPHDRGWGVRYKLLRGRVFVHAQDRISALRNLANNRHVVSTNC